MYSWSEPVSMESTSKFPCPTRNWIMGSCSSMECSVLCGHSPHVTPEKAVLPQEPPHIPGALDPPQGRYHVLQGDVPYLGASL